MINSISTLVVVGLLLVGIVAGIVLLGRRFGQSQPDLQRVLDREELPSSDEFPWLPTGSGEERDVQQIIDPRILLPLSVSPGAAQGLLAVASALKYRNETEPIDLCTVVNEREDDSKDRVHDADRFLTQVVEKNTVTTVPLVAHTAVGTDVPTEIVTKSHEQEADIVLMRWDAMAPTDDSLFGRTIDSVLQGTSLPIYLVDTEATFAVSHLHIVIPWEIDHHVGFYEAVYNLKQLAAKHDAGMTVYVFEESVYHYQQLFDLVEIDVPTEFEAASTWAEVNTTLKTEAQPSDFVIALAVREGARGWDEELPAMSNYLDGVSARSRAIFFLREDDPERDDHFLRV